MKLVPPTPEQLQGYTNEQVKVVRENAIRHNVVALQELCDAELARRAPKRPRIVRIRDQESDHCGLVVVGFHFVCADEQGVTHNPDGSLWTGTWVVAKEHAERAPKIESYVALHSAKIEPSYLQGVVKDVRRSERERSYAEGQEVQTEYGFDFLFEPTDVSYEWHGGGTGEKGYAWGTPPTVG